jgi:hypothetical protein
MLDSLCILLQQQFLHLQNFVQLWFTDLLSVTTKSNRQKSKHLTRGCEVESDAAAAAAAFVAAAGGIDDVRAIRLWFLMCRAHASASDGAQLQPPCLSGVVLAWGGGHTEEDGCKAEFVEC